jgi:hypothetical protein
MPPHKKRIPPFGDDARRRAVISGLAADACGLSARRRTFGFQAGAAMRKDLAAAAAIPSMRGIEGL